MKINKDKIKELVKILDELNLSELSYSDGKESIKVGKGSTMATTIASNNSKDEVPRKSVSKFEGVKSPMVGTAYLAPEPGAKPFVSVGSKIKKDYNIVFLNRCYGLICII